MLNTYKSIIKKKKKHDKIVLLGKDKLNTIEVLTSMTLIGLYIGHDEIFLVNNVFCGIYFIKAKDTYHASCKNFTANKNSSVKKN